MVGLLLLRLSLVHTLQLPAGNHKDVERKAEGQHHLSSLLFVWREKPVFTVTHCICAEKSGSELPRAAMGTRGGPINAGCVSVSLGHSE